MPRVTALEPQRFQQDRLNVHLDGQFAFSLTLQVATEAGLCVGSVLSPEEIERLHDRDRQQRAIDRALGFLSYRPRSEREVRQNLERGGYEPVYIGAAVERLRGWGYLSDAQFASYWIENRTRHSPRGERALKGELQRKGVDRAVVDAALEEAAPDAAEAAVRAGRRKAQQLAAFDPPLFRQRLGAFLARRGFDWETIKAAVAALQAEVGQGASTDADE